MNTECSRLVIARGDYSAWTAAADRNGVADELGSLSKFDGRIKAVHVQMDDFSQWQEMIVKT
jgi:hypothetical protein